jgi:protein SCO1/2
VPRWNTFLILLPALVFQACNRPEPASRFPLEGQALAVRPAVSEVVVKHGDVPGLMPAMVMPFKVRDATALNRVKAGDFVRATVVVAGNESWLEQLAPTGRHAPVPEDVALPHVVERPLEPGDEVPGVTLQDQDGAPFSPVALKGHPWAVTFIYTRCPLPTFCPAIDRRFAAVQRLLAADAGLADAKLVSVTMDPDYDRPPILRAHAQRLGADAARWRFVTGDKDTVDRFGERFGLMVVRGHGTPEEFVHSLRTAVIDRQGRLLKRFDDSSWDAETLVAALRTAAAR